MQISESNVSSWVELNWVVDSRLTFGFLVFSNWHNWNNPMELCWADVSQKWSNSKMQMSLLYNFLNLFMFKNRIVLNENYINPKKTTKKVLSMRRDLVSWWSFDVGFKAATISVLLCLFVYVCVSYFHMIFIYVWFAHSFSHMYRFLSQWFQFVCTKYSAPAYVYLNYWFLFFNSKFRMSC